MSESTLVCFWCEEGPAYPPKRLCRSCRLERERARKAVHDALRSGELVKSNFCQACYGEFPSGEIHSHHHWGYSKACAVDIIWLCRDCHWEAHRHWTTLPQAPIFQPDVERMFGSTEDWEWM